MHVIPVLDIKSGVVVHAAGGDRERYRPISTPLSPTADPLDVARGLLSLFPFETIYIADLDGISGNGRNHDTICALRAELPQLALWIDDGSASADAIAALARMPGVRPVAGSETLKSAEDLDAINSLPGVDAILSLDFAGSAYLGPPDLIGDPRRWPRTVIAMTLAAVGAEAGPDIERVRHLMAMRGDAEVVAAGGVRDAVDLVRLRDAGAAGVLVATALHGGTIKAGDLAEITGLSHKWYRS